MKPVTPEQACWLLEHPLTYGGESLDPYRNLLPQPDGSLLTVVLAVDR